MRMHKSTSQALIGPALLAFALAACQQPANDTDIAIDNGVEATKIGNNRDLPPAVDNATIAPVNSEASAPSSVVRNPPQSNFPIAIRGTWRESLGKPPTAQDCIGSANANIGKVIDIRATNFGIFEEGGRIIEVRQRADDRLRAIFDTTYADTPTRDDLTFTVDPVAKTLTVANNDPGEENRRVFNRCPR